MRRTQLFSAALLALAWLAGGTALAHDGDHSYTNGICTIEGCTDKYQAPALVDGWYELTNAGNVEWIGDYVENVAIDPKVKMMNDIDFTGVEHTMIGRSDSRKFNGIFDGQGHRITNLVLNYGSNDTPDAIGFFAWVRGGSTIKNLIMDKTCYFEGKVRVAAFVGVTQVANAGPVTIENCVNEANVQGHTGATGGFIGCRNPKNQDTPQAIISGCVNLGNILCDVNEAAAFVGWANSASNKHIVENSYNLGNISSDGNKRGFIRGDNLQITNSYDFGPNKANNSQNVSFEWATDDPVASGELAYRINQVAEAQIFYQTLSTDAYPIPFSTSEQVYAHGKMNCDGSSVPGTTYDNNGPDGIIQTPHDISDEIGMCTFCHTQFQAPALVDGYYEIKNAGNLEWFSNKVDEGGDANLQINAKLMNDIDMLSIENLHKPIGQTTAKKYNGTFDGQGFRIKNMIIERPNDSNIGFFGFLRGNAANTTVKNLIMDKSCTIHGYNRVGGITGSCQNNGTLITIENVINEATVIAEHQDAAGIIGGQEGNGPKWLIKNVLNTGTITAKNEAPYAGALCCYLGGNGESVIENFVNLGTINGHRGGNIGRIAGTYTNIIDLSDTDFESSLETNYGLESGLTKDDIANGKLAYTVGWGQFLAVNAYPTPLNYNAPISYVGDAGYATMYDNTTGYVLNGDVEAYVATPNPEYPNLILTEIENVPESTPVILKGTYYNKFANKVPAINITNALKGTDSATEADGTMYVLAKPEGKEVGFYLAKAGTTIAAGKAYYQPTSNQGVKAFYFSADDATGIEETLSNSTLKGENIYNLAGQRVSKMQKGINIVNGKKILK